MSRGKGKEADVKLPRFVEENALTIAAGTKRPVAAVVEDIKRYYSQTKAELPEHERWQATLVAVRPAAKLVGQGPKSAADALVEIARRVELFHDSADQTYATVGVDRHRETYRLGSSRFREWLAREYWHAYSEAANADAVSTAMNVIRAMALFDGPCLRVFCRVGEHEGEVWVDLGDAEWRSIRITGSGWSVEQLAPIRFVRGRNTLPLPAPERGGSLRSHQ